MKVSQRRGRRRCSVCNYRVRSNNHYNGTHHKRAEQAQKKT